MVNSKGLSRALRLSIIGTVHAALPEAEAPPRVFIDRKSQGVPTPAAQKKQGKAARKQKPKK